MLERNKHTAMTKGRVLSFEQPGDFFLRRGTVKLDKNNLVDALANYRQALSLEPDNVEYKLAIAEVLTEMNRFEESNRILFTLFEEGECEISECYFGMGCNFLGLQDFDHARDSLESYLQLDPEGDFIDDAYDMLDMLSDNQLLCETLAGDEACESQALQSAQLGKAMLERNDIKGAISALEKAIKICPDMSFVRNNLALAYFCDHDYERAMEQVHAILLKDPSNIQAHCNLAIFCNAVDDKKAVEQELEFLTSRQIQDFDDMHRMAITLMELNRFEQARVFLKRLYQMLPYDSGIIHRLAVCNYKLGKYRQALNLYDRLVKIDPNDTVAQYYRNVCRRTIGGEPPQTNLLINYQVPFKETLERISWINKCMRLPSQELLEVWNGGRLEAMLKWALDIPDYNVKHTMLGIVMSFGDKRAEGILRDFLLQRMQPDELKREVFGMLKQMGAKESYYGYINGKLVQSRVNIVKVSLEDLPGQYRDVIETCILRMQHDREDQLLVAAVKLWGDYCAGIKKFTKLGKLQITAMAAAIEYLTCRGSGIRVTKKSICSKYDISIKRLNTAIDKITKHTAKDSPRK